MGTAPPSNAIVLFDAKSMDKWVMAKDKAPSRWVLDKGEKQFAEDVFIH